VLFLRLVSELLSAKTSTEHFSTAGPPIHLTSDRLPVGSWETFSSWGQRLNLVSCAKIPSAVTLLSFQGIKGAFVMCEVLAGDNSKGSRSSQA